MISQQHRDALKSMAKTNFGIALKAYIDDELIALNDVEACTSWEDTLGRRHAQRSLKKLRSLIEGDVDKSSVPNQYT